MNLLDLETEVREQLNELMADEDPNLDLMLADVQLLIVLRQIRESEMHTGSGIQPDPATKGGSKRRDVNQGARRTHG